MVGRWYAQIPMSEVGRPSFPEKIAISEADF